jgi:hypothetical protein
MSKSRTNTVQIVNPRPGGASYTSRRSALGFVRRGLAIFEPDENALRFINLERRERNRGHDDGQGESFWWRRGTTGGMVQRIGSVVIR